MLADDRQGKCFIMPLPFIILIWRDKLRSKALICIILVMSLIVPALSISEGRTEEADEIPTRDGEEDYTLRSDTNFFPGEPRVTKYADVDGDGNLDMLIITRERIISDNYWYLHIISLNDGQFLFNHSFNLSSGASLDLIEADDDPMPELMLREQDHNPLKARLFILDTMPFTILFDSGYMSGYISGEIMGDELIVQRTYKEVSYVADQDTWFAAYSLSNWSMVWRTIRFPRASGAYIDLDGDGFREYLFYATWASPPPGKAHVYFIDLDAHKVTFNSTDMEFMNYWGGGRSALDYRDIDNDGKFEVVTVARWSVNSSCKVFLHSASVNDTLWVSENLGDYSLRENVLWYDVNGDGVEEIFLTLSEPGNEYISKLVVLDPLTGDVLLEEQVDNRFHPSNIHFADMNGDDNLDVFFYNYTSWYDGDMWFKMAEPLNGWSLAYDVAIKGVRRFDISDMDKDGIVDIMIIGEGSSAGDNLMDLRRYDPADMGQVYTLGDYDLGQDGEFTWSWIYSGSQRSINIIAYNYRNPTGGNHSQLLLFNITKGTLEYTSKKVFGEAMTHIRWENHMFNDDDVKDLIIGYEWMNEGDPDSWLNISIVDCSSFEEIWSAGPFQNLDYWQSQNGSFHYWGDLRELYIRYSTGTEDRFYHALFDLSGDTPTVIFEITDNVFHDLSEIDRWQTGEFLLEDITSRGGIINVSYFDIGIGKSPEFVTSFELEGEYGYGKGIDAAKDGDSILYYRTGSNPTRVYYLDPDTFEIINSLELYDFERYTIDPDKDGIKEDVWIERNDLGSTGSTNMTFIDLETGMVKWELSGPDHSFKISVMDIDGDRRNEMLLTKTRYWENPFSIGVSVYNVSTDLPPDQLSPIEEVQMIEDGPSVTIDLDDHFSDEEDPLTFEIDDVDDVIDWSVDTSTNVLTLTPSPDMNGMHPLILHVMDAYWDIEYEFMVNITPVNDAPVLINVSGISDLDNLSVPVDQEVENLIHINALDVDGDDLMYSLTGEHERISINSSSGVITFTPLVEDGPETVIEVNVTDGQETLTFDFTTMNEYVPHAPVNVQITSPANGTSSYGTWTFSGTADDPDLPWGDELTFTWASNVDGLLGEGEEITVSGLSTGNHLISLDVMDSDGLIDFDIIMIEVLPFVSFENLTGIEPTGNLSLVIDLYTVDAYFESINGSTFATYDVFIKGTGGPDLLKVLLYIYVPVDDEYIPFDPMKDGHAEGIVNGTMWEYSRTYTIKLPGTDHTEEDLRTILFEMAVVGWNSDSLFDTAYKAAEMSYSFEDVVPDDDDDDDIVDDDTVDDDTTDVDDDDTENKGSGVAIALVLVFIILLLIGIIAGILVSRSRGRRDEMEWGEE